MAMRIVFSILELWRRAGRTIPKHRFGIIRFPLVSLLRGGSSTAAPGIGSTPRPARCAPAGSRRAAPVTGSTPRVPWRPGGVWWTARGTRSRARARCARAGCATAAPGTGSILRRGPWRPACSRSAAPRTASARTAPWRRAGPCRTAHGATRPARAPWQAAGCATAAPGIGSTPRPARCAPAGSRRAAPVTGSTPRVPWRPGGVWWTARGTRSRARARCARAGCATAAPGTGSILRRGPWRPACSRSAASNTISTMLLELWRRTDGLWPTMAKHSTRVPPARFCARAYSRPTALLRPVKTACLLPDGLNSMTIDSCSRTRGLCSRVGKSLMARGITSTTRESCKRAGCIGAAIGICSAIPAPCKRAGIMLTETGITSTRGALWHAAAGSTSARSITSSARRARWSAHGSTFRASCSIQSCRRVANRLRLRTF